MREIKIGTVLQRMLWKRRKNLKEVSRETGIPYSTLHTWQLNRQPKDVLKAQRLAEYFDISLHELLFDQEDLRTSVGATEVAEPSWENFLNGRFEIRVKRIE